MKISEKLIKGEIFKLTVFLIINMCLDKMYSSSKTKKKSTNKKWQHCI